MQQHADIQERLTFAKVARRCGVHVSTVHRWAENGHKGVKLNARRLGGRWVTTPEDIAEFERRCTEVFRAQDAGAPAAEDEEADFLEDAA